MYKLRFCLPAGEAKEDAILTRTLSQYQIKTRNFCKDFNDKSSIYLKGMPMQVVLYKTGISSVGYKMEFQRPSLKFLLDQVLLIHGTLNIYILYDLYQIWSKFIYKPWKKENISMFFSSLNSITDIDFTEYVGE